MAEPAADLLDGSPSSPSALGTAVLLTREGTVNRRSARHPRSNTPIPAAVYAVVVALLAVAAMWPIYQTARLWLVAGVGSGISGALIWLGNRYRWGSLTILALAGAFVLTVVPVAVPSAFSSGMPALLHAERDALAAVALGWKQILTLTLPPSTYQNVLVPAYLLCLVASARHRARVQRRPVLPLAAFPALLPVLFGTFFGSSIVSEPMQIGPLHLSLPVRPSCGCCRSPPSPSGSAG